MSTAVCDRPPLPQAWGYPSRATRTPVCGPTTQLQLNHRAIISLTVANSSDSFISRECGPQEVRVKVAYSGICGTAVTEYMGGPIFPPQEGHIHPHTGVSLPVTMVHEFSGTITEIGSGVTHLQVGQCVVISPAYDHCHYETEYCEPW